MKKKGFTLVELLAVIAILAILVIIALPNVMSLFNEAKKNSFSNELKEIFKTAEQEYMTSNFSGGGEKKYARGANNATLSACGTSQLKLSGRTGLQYGITLNSSGKVTSFVATDGTFAFQYSGTELKVEEIGSVTASEYNTQKAIVTLADYNKTGAEVSCNGTTTYQLTFTPAS